jgi:hypothetical protein
VRSRLTAVAAAVAMLVAAPAAFAHQGDPNFLSQVTGVTPGDGVTVEVLNRDDRLLIHNTSGQDVVVEGYDGEPYARLLADGTVQVNKDSPAYYLNDDRFADVEVPDDADGKGAPRWEEVDKAGRFEWHDHRMHWMAKTTPPQVKDESVETKIFDWSIPIEVGGQPGEIAGTLSWTPLPGGGAPWLLIGIVVVVLCGVLAVIAARRNRRHDDPRPHDPRSDTTAEAW